MSLHLSIPEVRLLDGGGLYVVVEFRKDASDPEPFWTNDFRWNGFIPWVERRPLVRDDAGRIRVRNKWVWPTVYVDGDLAPHPALDQAEMQSLNLDAVLDELLVLVFEKGEAVEAALEFGFEGPPDTTLPGVRRPNENASPTAAQAAVKSAFPSEVVDSLASVQLRRTLRRR